MSIDNGLDYQLYRCSGRQIRLLVIQKDVVTRAGGVLNCTMQVASLDNAPPYAAISYVWGRESGRSKIVVDNSTLEISRSAETALQCVHQRLCGVDGTCYIWIDTVCVDQSDDADRSHQVASMADVYRNALEVLVFLGPEFEGSADIMLSIAQTVEDLDLEAAVADPDSPGRQDSGKLQQCLDLLDVDLLGRFFASPWFMRLWVVQESVLSKKATFLYGSAGVDMSCALVLATYLRELDYMKFESRGRKIERMEQMEYATELYTARWRRSQAKQLNNLSEHEVGNALANVLYSFHDRHNIDPRDKVYAILGLCWSSTAGKLTPDYSKSLRDIYLQATTLAYTEFETNAYINILRYARTMGHKPTSWYKENNWPTWVPCWQCPFDLIKNPSNILQSERAATDQVASETEELLSVEGDRLSFNGIVIDTLIEMTPPMTRYKEKKETGEDQLAETRNDESDNERVVVRVEDVENAIDQCMALDVQSIRLPDQRSLMSIIGQTLVAGDPTYGDDFEIGGKHFKSVLQSTRYKSSSREQDADVQSKETADSGNPWTYLTDYDVNSPFRVCFVTSKGFFGLTSEHAAVGDLVCVPQGSQIPYVIRPEDDHFILVGQCYMHSYYLSVDASEHEQRRFHLR